MAAKKSTAKDEIPQVLVGFPIHLILIEDFGPAKARKMWTQHREASLRHIKGVMADRKDADEADTKAAQTPVPLFLPGCNEDNRAMPNHVARSALFAPVKMIKKGRKFHDRIVIHSRSDVEINYTGKQLDEAQADVWLQLMYEARRAPLGEPVVINRAQFLRAIGKTAAGKNYTWLETTLHAFTVATLVVKAKRKDGESKYHVGARKVFHMLEGYGYNPKKEEYEILVDPRWQQIFGSQEYALMSWSKRLQIGRGHYLAKALQRLIATSNNNPQYYSLEWLKEWAQYQSPTRKFRAALLAATEELVRLDVIAGAKIDTSTRGKEQLIATLPTSG